MFQQNLPFSILITLPVVVLLIFNLHPTIIAGGKLSGPFRIILILVNLLLFMLLQFILPYLGHYKLVDLKPEHFREFMRTCEK